MFLPYLHQVNFFQKLMTNTDFNKHLKVLTFSSSSRFWTAREAEKSRVGTWLQGQDPGDTEAARLCRPGGFRAGAPPTVSPRGRSVSGSGSGEPSTPVGVGSAEAVPLPQRLRTPNCSAQGRPPPVLPTCLPGEHPLRGRGAALQLPLLLGDRRPPNFAFEPVIRSGSLATSKVQPLVYIWAGITVLQSSENYPCVVGGRVLHSGVHAGSRGSNLHIQALPGSHMPCG